MGFGEAFLFFLVIGYILGSIPFGFILTKLAGLGDIRDIGSGNIGATNVLRTGNKKLALATLILDTAKAAIPIGYIHYMSLNTYNDPYVPFVFVIVYWLCLTIGLGAILGHCFPIWLKFKGGKGVATALGVLLTAVPYAGLAACITWLITAKISKISSLSALTALAIAPVITLLFYDATSAIICTLITALVFYRHKDNIKRLHEGTEPKIGGKKDAARTP